MWCHLNDWNRHAVLVATDCHDLGSAEQSDRRKYLARQPRRAVVERISQDVALSEAYKAMRHGEIDRGADHRQRSVSNSIGHGQLIRSVPDARIRTQGQFGI